MFIIQEPCDCLSTPPPPGGGPLALITGLRQSHLGLHPRVVCVMCVGSWEREGTHVAQTTRWRPHGGGVISGQEAEEVQEEDVALGREGPLGVGTEEREADRSQGTKSTSGLGPSDPSIPFVPQKSSRTSISAH